MIITHMNTSKEDFFFIFLFFSFFVNPLYDFSGKSDQAGREQ